ncbi:MAG TPA: bifunctional diaminohydroxyphosphoribosylaminopyrimidine deaminase/5-amino-6-(5-phosphoribosylamino)uracil reductase RibD [Gemmatimonadales bacterium]|jgi:diaminohydroxyphosphoribosylaminopyrimidine deaminase/5-amino-6-(5-phosphoribosylamino)uracil reductase
MARALELATRGWGRTSPNPRVGCVLMREGEIVSEGWHREFGGAHAEIDALERCPDPSGTTCIVNLEPCTHHGKTGPCVDALVRAKVSRVVIGIRDPNPEAMGGVEKLTAAGISVAVGLMREEAAALNAPFLWRFRRPNRPFVALKVATSLDGFLADAWKKAQWISGDDAREHVHFLRAGYGAVAVGRNTAESDDPLLTARGRVLPREQPTRVIFTRNGVLTTTLKVVRTAREVPTVVLAESAGAERARKDLEPHGVTVLTADGLAASLTALRGIGVTSVLVEGGGILATNLLAADLVDRLYWVQAPFFLGGGTSAFGDRSPVHLDEVNPWVVTERQALGPDTLLVVDRELCLPAS